MNCPQTRIDRGEQLRLLRDYQPRPYEFRPGKRVSTLAMKAVLKAIDCRAGNGGICFAAQVTIANDAGLKCTKTVARAYEGLTTYGAIEPLGRRCRGDSRPVHHFRVNYQAIKAAMATTPPSNRTPVPVATSQNGEATGHRFPSNGTLTPEQPDTGSQATRHSFPQPALDPTMTRPTPAPDRQSGKWGALVDELDLMGMHTAPDAINAARTRKAPPEYVRFLIDDAKRKGASNGLLCNWIKGTTTHTVTPERFERTEAQKIAERVQAAGIERGADQLAIDSATFKELTKYGLERFATDAQCKAPAQWESAQKAVAAPPDIPPVLIEGARTLDAKPPEPKAKFKRASSHSSKSNDRRRELDRQLAELGSGSTTR